MNSKLFCSFVNVENIDLFIQDLSQKYTIINNRIFILESNNSTELICTYNLDMINMSQTVPNTILTHRKKEVNVLYTINALNELIKHLNNGVINTRFPIPWDDYKNSLILIKNNEVQIVPTTLYKIFYL